MSKQQSMVENRLIKMGYILDELDQDNPYNQFLCESTYETKHEGKSNEHSFNSKKTSSNSKYTGKNKNPEK